MSYEAEREAGRLEEPSCGADSETALLESERSRILLDAVAALPPRQRAALVLRDLEGMTSECAASILGSTAATIRAQVAAARNRLKRTLDAGRERRGR